MDITWTKWKVWRNKMTIDPVSLSILVTTISTLILSVLSKVKKSVCCGGQVEIDMLADTTTASTITKPVNTSTNVVTGTSTNKSWVFYLF